MAGLIPIRLKTAGLAVAWLGFACRLVVPAGYMPAAPEEGGFIRLCPAGAAGALLAPVADPHAGHHSPVSDTDVPGHDHPAEHGYTTEYCPAGTFFSAAAATPDFAVRLLHLSFDRPVARDRAFSAPQRLLSQQPRAPPLQPA